MIAVMNYEFALELAKRLHEGQVDKAGEAYINHPLKVAEYVENEEEIVRVVAVLHDTVEDTPMTVELIRVLFGNEVGNAIESLTKKPGEEYMEYIQRVKKNQIAAKVKLADLRHNSELSRLSEVTEKDIMRVEKYKKAMEILNG